MDPNTYCIEGKTLYQESYSAVEQRSGLWSVSLRVHVITPIVYTLAPKSFLGTTLRPRYY